MTDYDRLIQIIKFYDKNTFTTKSMLILTHEYSNTDFEVSLILKERRQNEFYNN